MTARARFDLTMDAEDKDVVSRAAALMGATMAGFNCGIPELREGRRGQDFL